MKSILFNLRNSNPYRLLWAVILIERLATILIYNLRTGDSDQTILWHMAKDLMEGEFHTFTFYGQSYNLALEAFLVLPFLKLGLSYPLSFALITTLLSLLPFWVLSNLFYKTWGEISGTIPLVVLLLLPPEYLMLTSISRGFVQGIALSSVALYAWHGTQRNLYAIIAGLFIPMAIMGNPNCLLFLPVFLLFHQHPLKRYAWFGLGFCLGLLLVYLHTQWFLRHPEYIIHPAPGFSVSWQYAQKILHHLDDYFNSITPVFWRLGWLLIPLFMVLIVFLMTKVKWPLKVSLALWGIGLVFSFFLEKTTDATGSVYFSGGRMFLAWPFLWVVVLGMSYSLYPKPKWLSGLIPLVCGLGLLKSLLLPFFIRWHHAHQTNHIVHVFNHKDLKYQCLVFQNLSQKLQVDLMEGVSGHTGNQHIAYACPCLIPDFPQTYLSGYERRTWLSAKRGWYNRVLEFSSANQDTLKMPQARVLWKHEYPDFYIAFRENKGKPEEK
jgi:hypothetical protein